MSTYLMYKDIFIFKIQSYRYHNIQTLYSVKIGGEKEWIVFYTIHMIWPALYYVC